MLATKVKAEVKQNFATEQWPEIVETTARVFRMTPKEKGRLAENKTAMLIGAIPFLADCDQPMRTAISHVAIYHIARAEGKSIFEHNPGDDRNVFDRLKSIMNFQGGDPVVINRGMNCLALQMVNGYVRDKDSDRFINKYNPVTAGVWNVEEQIDFLSNAIKVIDSPEMEEIYNSDIEPMGWWNEG
ncbi:MAG: hypothetical protein OEZ34_17220 [Spirochaetia bacterium]|nr:hypothetical protein [Spirochaetia bacterium]